MFVLTSGRSQIFPLLANNFVYRKLDFDPTAAVHLQGRFVDKVHSYGRLASPTVVPFLRSATDCYQQFFALVAQGSGTVPTVDVDLVWHTHQLAPRRYAVFCNKFAGRFVNHDDSDAPGRSEQREELFARTKATYRAVFASEYRICLS